MGSVIPHIGQTVEAAVIGVDFYNRTLELLLHPSLVKDVRRVVNVNGVVSRVMECFCIETW